MSELKIDYIFMKDSEYVKVEKINYCCDKMKAKINPKYITSQLIMNMVKKCPYCGADIILKEVDT